MRMEISPRLAISSFVTVTGRSTLPPDPARRPLFHKGAWAFLKVLGRPHALSGGIADLPKICLGLVVGLSGHAQAFAYGDRCVNRDATGQAQCGRQHLILWYNLVNQAELGCARRGY